MTEDATPAELTPEAAELAEIKALIEAEHEVGLDLFRRAMAGPLSPADQARAKLGVARVAAMSARIDELLGFTTVKPVSLH